MDRKPAVMYDWGFFVTSGYPLKSEPSSTAWCHPHEQFGFEWEVHALLDYDEKGFLRAGCMYFPNGGPMEPPGSVSVIVRKNERRKGIATRLLAVMMDTYTIDLSQQHYSDAGWAFIQGFAEKATGRTNA